MVSVATLDGQILSMKNGGYTNRGIAEQLGIGICQVDNIVRKLGLSQTRHRAKIVLESPPMSYDEVWDLYFKTTSGSDEARMCLDLLRTGKVSAATSDFDDDDDE